MAASSASTRPRRRKKAAAGRPKPPSAGWWGDGPPPWRRWPGVTIELPARWNPAGEIPGHEEKGRWESPDGLYYFDAEAAQLAVDFFPEFLRHHKGEFGPSPQHPEGQPFQLLTFQDLLIVRPLFGWKRAADNLRRFRKVFFAVPKGNGKSPLGAGLGLLLAFADGEAGAEVYCAAADREQAAIVFDTAKIMVEASPDLAEQCQVWRRAIEIPATHSYYRVLSADVRSKHGPNIHALIFDEFHAQATRELYEVLHRGTVKRRQPVTLMITTAGDDDETICAEEWDYARNVMKGPVDGYADDAYLPVIFEAAKKDRWDSEDVWRRVNPGFGITVQADAIRSEAVAARNEPRKMNDFLRYHLNRWVNQATAWIPIDWWDDCESELPANLPQLQPQAGLDMAQKNDLASFVLTFPIPLEPDVRPIETEVLATDEVGQVVKKKVSLNYRIALVPHFWIPEATMREHIKTDKVRYDIWEEAGLLKVTEGNVIDYDVIFQDITGEIADKYPLLRQAQIGYDPAFATDIAQKLMGKGYQCVEVLQNYQRLSEASLIFEAFVKGKRVVHDGHAVLRWNMENVAIKTDPAGRIRPVKSRKRAKRIDGVVAALMGLSRIIVQPGEDDGGWIAARVPLRRD